MCGLVFVSRFDDTPARKQLIKRYTKQSNRGTDGFGYMVIKQSGNVGKVQRFQFEHELKASLEQSKAREILLHHRYPTSTPNLPEETHPIKVSHPELEFDYYVTHNGVIANSDELKDEHEKLGYKYTTELFQSYKTRYGGKVYQAETLFNDSEAFAIELARNIEGKTGEVKARGSIAYITLQTDKEGKAIALYYGSNEGNPLTVQVDKHYICIASEGGTMLESHKHYKLALQGHIISEFDGVKLIGHRAAGYVPYTSSLGEDDYTWYPSPKKSKHKSDSDRSLWELESELEEIDSDIDLAREEGLQAMSTGDIEGEDTWKYELKQLEARRSVLMALIEKTANATA